MSGLGHLQPSYLRQFDRLECEVKQPLLHHPDDRSLSAMSSHTLIVFREKLLCMFSRCRTSKTFRHARRNARNCRRRVRFLRPRFGTSSNPSLGLVLQVVAGTGFADRSSEQSDPSYAARRNRRQRSLTPPQMVAGSTPAKAVQKAKRHGALVTALEGENGCNPDRLQRVIRRRF